MVQESNKPRVGIIGAGPAGCCAAYFLKDDCSVVLIDYSQPMRTILPTGGGRCNLAYAEYDFRELVKYYPRGEKFLYSIFSKFSTIDTVWLFERLGVTTYVQQDSRIFPDTNSSKDIQDAFLRQLKTVTIKKERALRIETLKDKIKVVTDMDSYFFDSLIVSTGGHAGYEMVERLGIKIVPPKPALVGLVTKENLKSLAGVSLADVESNGMKGDILFTHKGVSGPLIYKISSIKARDNMPYSLALDLYPETFDLQQLFNDNPHKQINNLLSEFLPKKVVNYILKTLCIDEELKCHRITGDIRDLILENIHNFTVNVVGVNKDGEVVTAGGIDLNEVNPKSLESKKIKGLYFIGEILDIDGFCGGFNLQNCWSTAYVAANSILDSNI